MPETHPKLVRRILLEILYDSFLKDPLKMLTPAEIFEQTEISRDALATGAHYLHERDLVELMLGYNPPLFAAIRIAPDGVDLYEDPYRLERYFAQQGASKTDKTQKLIPLLLRLAQEAEALPLDGLRKEWLLRDVTDLREALRRPEVEWDYGVVATLLRWIDAIAPGDTEPAMSSMAELKEMFGEALE